MPDSRRRIVKILVAAPGDVDSERKIVEEVIAEWNICNGDLHKLLLERCSGKNMLPQKSGEMAMGSRC